MPPLRRFKGGAARAKKTKTRPTTMTTTDSIDNDNFRESYEASLNRMRVTKARELLSVLYSKVRAYHDAQDVRNLKAWEFGLDLRCEVAGLMGLMGGELPEAAEVSE